jgi:enamine deaminase RidA (YjgF/YER057c/UK114 family)
VDTTKRVFSGSPWEKAVSYCRAIKKGNFIAVSGTTSVKDGKTFAPGDHYEQTKRCLEIIEEALLELGRDRSSVVRTRIFVTDISKWKFYGAAHQEFFADCPPATSMIEIKSLISSELLVEIEADAVAE